MGCTKFNKFIKSFKLSLHVLSQSRKDSSERRLPKRAVTIDNTTLNGLIAIDASGLIHAALGTQKGGSIAAYKYHQFDKFTDSDGNLRQVPMKIAEVTDYVRERLNYFIENNWGVVLVFDGLSPEIKRAENEARKQQRVERRTKVQDLLANESVDSTDLARALRAAVSVRADIVADVFALAGATDCVIPIVAPFEADHQIAYMVRENICQAAYGRDADFIALGCHWVLHSLTGINKPRPADKKLTVQDLDASLRESVVRNG